MITLRCTRKLLDLLDQVPKDDPPSPTAALGDWYANVIPTLAGDLIIFVNERTFLSVALPVEAIDGLVPRFVTRVYNLLLMIDVPQEVARLERDELRPVTFAKTASRSVLGVMKDVALGYDHAAARFLEDGEVPRIWEAELAMSRRIHSPTDYAFPFKVAKALLADHYRGT